MTNLFENKTKIFSTKNIPVAEYADKDIQFLKTAINSRESLKEITEQLFQLQKHYEFLISSYSQIIEREVDEQLDNIDVVIAEYFSSKGITQLDLEEAVIEIKNRKSRFERTDIPCGMNCTQLPTPITVFEDGTPEYEKLHYLMEVEQLPEGIKFVPFKREVIVTRKKQVPVDGLPSID